MSELYAGVLFFPIQRSAEVLHAWRVDRHGAGRSPRSA